MGYVQNATVLNIGACTNDHMVYIPRMATSGQILTSSAIRTSPMTTLVASIITRSPFWEKIFIRT